MQKNTNVYQEEVEATENEDVKLDMLKWQVYRNGNTRKGYWAVWKAEYYYVITNERLAREGYYEISEAYKSALFMIEPPCTEGMHSSVSGLLIK